MSYFGLGPSRYVCDVLGEMRKTVGVMDIWNYSRSKSLLKSLIEEVQTLANRMESGLEDKKNVDDYYPKQLAKLKKEIKELEKKKAMLAESLPDEDDD